jgi:tRNA G37 N-methylase TrmD
MVKQFFNILLTKKERKQNMKLSNLFGKTTNAYNNTFVIRGTLLEIVKYAQDNKLSMHQVPTHLVGGYFKSITTANLEAIPIRVTN